MTNPALPLLPLLLSLRLPCRRDRGTVGRGTLIVGAGGLANWGRGLLTVRATLD